MGRRILYEFIFEKPGNIAKMEACSIFTHSLNRKKSEFFINKN